MNAWKTTFPFGARPIFRGELLVSGIIESKIAILQFYGHPDCSTVLIHSRRRSVSKGPGAASLKGLQSFGALDSRYYRYKSCVVPTITGLIRVVDLTHRVVDLTLNRSKPNFGNQYLDPSSLVPSWCPIIRVSSGLVGFIRALLISKGIM